MIVGAAIAATDSAAIFAVLRRSTLEKRLARSLEGESGMNDPVALLLVIGFIEWIQEPGYGLADMAGLLALKLAVGIGDRRALIGRLAVAGLDRVRLPTDGIYPVATIAIAGLAYGLAEVAHGSGLLAVYLTALALGRRQHPGPPHGRRLPRGARLGRPDRPLHPARPARLPQHARRRGAGGPGALGGR